MYIRRIVLEDLKAFHQLDFRFDRSGGKYAGWSVVTGDNASGKTSLLKAIALALIGPDSARTLQPSFRGWIRASCKEAVVAVEIVADSRDGFSKGRRYERPFWSELHMRGTNGLEVSLETGRKYTKKGMGPTHGPWAESPQGWFSAGYGPFRRLYGASPTAQRAMSGPGRVARFVTMFLEDATLGECELWLTDLNHKKLEGKQNETRALDQVLKLLNDEFLRNGLRVQRVDSEGLWLSDASNVVLPLADMSEGYRAALAMLVDILRHMVNVYGHEGLVTESEGRLIVPHPGVVLIDEMDSHLHPEWQRSIGFWLKERFPNIQFIVTTHSPLICQAADLNGIFHLPAPGCGDPFQLNVEDYWNIIRSTPNVIYVSPAFAMPYTRSPRVVNARAEYAKLKAKQHSVGLTHLDKQKQKLLTPFISEEEDSDAELCAESSVPR